MTVDTTGSLARVAAAAGDTAEAAERCRAILALWERSDDLHYALAGLRWGAAFLASTGDRAGAHACAEALTAMASASGHPDALAALGHAMAETALLEGDAESAAEQLARAVELHRDLDLPFERAQIELRAGAALAAVGEREPALERMGDAYRTARRLGARPLAAAAAGEVARLGESVAGRLGARAEADAGGAGLSRRELEVLRLVAVGRTNREIARDLFLSPRTVDMHVRNILRKLDCRSRVEAAGRARDLGIALARAAPLAPAPGQRPRHEPLGDGPVDRARERVRQRRVVEPELARGERAVVAVPVQDRAHARAAQRAGAAAGARRALRQRGDRARERRRHEPHPLAHAGQLGDELERLRRGDRRAVEHVARAGPPALGGEPVRLGDVGDVDDAHGHVDERRQLAVEVVDDQLAVAATRGPGPAPRTG